MAWEAAQPGTVAQDEQGAFHVKVGDSWIAAPKGTIAQDDKGAYHYDTDSIKAAPAPSPQVETPAATPQATGPVTLAGHALLDAGSTIARGVGAAGQAVQNTVATLTGGDQTPYSSPESLNNRMGNASIFSHAPDVAAPTTDPKEAIRAGLPKLQDQPAVQHFANETPAGQTLTQDVLPPVADVANAALTAEGGRGLAAKAPGLVKGAAGLADRAGNAVIPPNAAQAATVESNPKIAQARTAGFKLTGTDARAAVNAPDGDIPGNTRQNMAAGTATDPIQRHNRALSTQSMADDAGLANNRAIDAKQIEAGMTEAGKAYDALGSQVGKVAAPPELAADIKAAGGDVSSPTAREKIGAQVQFHLDHVAEAGLDGPSTVQTVKQLRRSAYKQMAAQDPDVQALGKANLKIATAYEDALMSQLPAGSDLATTFPAARTRLAKLNELDAVSEGGQVNASKVLQLQRNGAPLSGASAEVANAADVAPEAMSAAGPQGAPKLPITKFGIIRGAQQLGGKIVSSLPGMDPATEAFQTANYGARGAPVPKAPPIAVDPVAPAGPPVGPPPQAPVAPELAVGAGRASPTRKPVKSGPSGYSRLGEQAPVLPPDRTGLAVGENVASPGPSARPGPSGGLIPAPAVAPLPPVGLSVGENVASPGPSARPGPSGYGRLGESAPPSGVDPTLSVGENKPSHMTAAEKKAWEKKMMDARNARK